MTTSVSSSTALEYPTPPLLVDEPAFDLATQSTDPFREIVKNRFAEGDQRTHGIGITSVVEQKTIKSLDSVNIGRAHATAMEVISTQTQSSKETTTSVLKENPLKHGINQCLASCIRILSTDADHIPILKKPSEIEKLWHELEQKFVQDCEEYKKYQLKKNASREAVETEIREAMLHAKSLLKEKKELAGTFAQELQTVRLFPKLKSWDDNDHICVDLELAKHFISTHKILDKILSDYDVDFFIASSHIIKYPFLSQLFLAGLEKLRTHKHSQLLITTYTAAINDQIGRFDDDVFIKIINSLPRKEDQASVLELLRPISEVGKAYIEQERNALLSVLREDALTIPYHKLVPLAFFGTMDSVLKPLKESSKQTQELIKKMDPSVAGYLLSCGVQDNYAFDVATRLFKYLCDRIPNSPSHVFVSFAQYTSLSPIAMEAVLNTCLSRPDQRFFEFLTMETCKSTIQNLLSLHSFVTGETTDKTPEELKSFIPESDFVIQSQAPLMIKYLSALTRLPKGRLKCVSWLFERWQPRNEKDLRLVISVATNDSCIDFISRLQLKHKDLSLNSRSPHLIQKFFQWLQSSNSSSICPIQENQQLTRLFFTTLSHQEQYLFMKKAYPDDHISRVYYAEKAGLLETEVSTKPLFEVPTEPLIRYLGSKPFPQIEAWLKAKRSPEDTAARLDTLSMEQRRTILRRFYDSKSGLPLSTWRNLFHCSPEEALSVRLKDVSPPSKEVEMYHTELSHRFDSNDPTSLFAYELVSQKTIPAMICHLLTTAKEENLCGSRHILTWGNAEATRSPCIAQDAPPLFLRFKGQPVAVHVRGLFNDYSFNVAGYTLREKLLVLQAKNPNGYERIQSVQYPWEVSTSDEKELFLEISRIADYLYAQYPELAEITNKGLTDRTFLSQLRKTYISNAMSVPGYDRNNYSHRHAVLFQTLLQKAQQTSFTNQAVSTTVTIFGTIPFHIKAVEEKNVELLEEDNPGESDLYTMASDYPTYTLSAVTPQLAPLSVLKSCVETIQSLRSKRAFHLSALTEQILTENQYAGVSAHFDAWKSLWPSSIDGSKAKPTITALTRNYESLVDSTNPTLTPNTTYHLNTDRFDDYCVGTLVPHNLRHMGNFASIICASFIPYSPERHDGNCGVNAFLLGLYGVDTYERKLRNLNEDIRSFRNKVVSYAVKHQDELIETFGNPLIQNLIQFYAFEGPEWTGSEVWAIAAEIYGCPINLYNVDKTKTFRVDEHSKVMPLEQYQPSSSSTTTPINLLLWEIHYAFLQPRLTTPSL